jgi:tyrosine-protein kinase Etk/Wzc
MIEPTNGITTNDAAFKDNSWTISPKEIVFKYLKYLPWVIICIAIALVFAYLKIRWTPPIYHAQSSILIKDERADAGLSKDNRFGEMFPDESNVNLDNEIQILRSTPVMERVVKDLDFQTQYTNTGNFRSTLLYPESPIDLRVIHVADSSVGFSFRITILNENQFTIGDSKKPIYFGQIIERGANSCMLLRNSNVSLRGYPVLNFLVSWQPTLQVASQLVEGLKIVQANLQATILTVNFDGENVALSKNIINTLMAVYDTLIVEDKMRVSINSSSFIQESLDTLQKKLNGSESDIRNFMVKNDAFDVEEQSKQNLDRIGDASKSIEELRLKMLLSGQLLAYIEDNKNLYNGVPISLGIEEPGLTKLIEQFNNLQSLRESHLKTAPETNPYIITITGELDKTRKDIREVLLNVRKGYQLTLNEQVAKNGELQGQLKSIPGKSMRLANITAQKKILEDLYSFLLQKQYEINISSAATVANSKIIEPAASTYSPVTPNRKSIYSLYVLLGIIVPVVVIVLIEVLRDKITGRLDVEKRTHAPILGEIGHSDEMQNLVVTKNSRKFIAEQFRIIRSNLQYVIGKKEKPVIMVTSSFSGEGKSFVSTNMGGVMALAGKKTVIMEFDIRKPKIVSGLDLKRKMGITNYIIGKAEFKDLPLPVEGFDNLFVIPCGPVPPNPAELLLDKRLEDLMAEVKQNFDVIIMDTAPIGLVSDAVNLGRFVDCTLYIIRQGHTFRKQLRFIEDLYVEHKVPSISLLLNDIKAEGGYYTGYYGGYGGYGYGSGYGYGYGSGYFEDDASKKRKKSGIKKLLGIFK